MLLLKAAQASLGIAMSGPQGSWGRVLGQHPRPGCPLLTSGGQAGRHPECGICYHRPRGSHGPLPPAHLPGLCSHLVVLRPSLPQPEPPAGVVGAPCRTGLWVSGWDEAGSHPQLGACEEPPCPCPLAPSSPCQPLPPPWFAPPCISLWVSWSFIVCKCHLYNSKCP